ncbi:bifunctional hydroxymethylpyrimidine kinase/phosphomethylpyrimidine kinase [Stieleria sp. TO1_6]|uniref:bifunctional hydroxymethylpyrimidine kinase/phosphomethylpyrimidine kinase n=1 Tax=Stieleria tagensis TaxID=2956795 RepID=UPI00209AA172|nr:bifunctional hydroxymethylpyrimidine kinase/phosphomethylpyrimidine kinase [Stieleria tagensis]MCO8125265.1 bifunctional hydroxymethylpyrimidine kinase/phosphomethylpyrimidine kinase [Stieleria tagensis]
MADLHPPTTAVATALTIAGSDPSGGAGLQIDLKAFQQNQVYGMAVVTLLTVQNTQGVHAIKIMPPEWVGSQIDAVLDDIPPQAIKTGALGDVDNIHCVADRLADYTGQLVVDPVLVSKHGDRLADDSTVDAYRERLLPQSTLITPNRFEAERLLGRSLGAADRDALTQAALELGQMGPACVLLKAGRINGLRCHVLVTDGQAHSIDLPNHDTQQTHGAGCALSATLTARLALAVDSGVSLRTAVEFSLAAVNQAIAHAPGLGSKFGPINARDLGGPQ